MKKLLWITNIVPHYNRELFRALSSKLPTYGLDFHLLSGRGREGAVGRTGLTDKVIPNEKKVAYREWVVGGYCIRSLSGIADHVRTLRPAVIVTASQVGSLSTWHLIRLRQSLGFQLVAWQCGYEYHPNKLKAMLLRRYIPAFDFHLAYHSNARSYALNHGAREDQIAVMHNTLNEGRIQLIERAEARRRVAQAHPQVGNRKILLFVGAVLEEKRLDAVIQAMGLLARDDVVFIVVGDGPHLPYLKSSCAHRTDVIFAGQVIQDVGPYFDAADIFILPGTGGLAINEAMAHSLPVIAGYADGSAGDLVISGHNGVRLKSISPTEIGTSLGPLLDNDEVRRRMGEASRELLRERFSFEAFITRICSTVATLANAAPGAGTDSYSLRPQGLAR